MPVRWPVFRWIALGLSFALGLVACQSGTSGSSASDYEQAVTQSRVERDMEMRDKNSVLPVTVRESFQGLNYFPVNPSQRFVVPLRPFATPDTVMMPETTGGVGMQVKVGQVTVPVPPDSTRLTVFEVQEGAERGQLWIPFTDATNGDATYDAGRYVDLGDAPGDSVVVDFNRAYNPTCAYNPRYACPIPPPENRISVPVEAGEKKPRFRQG